MEGREGERGHWLNGVADLWVTSLSVDVTSRNETLKHNWRHFEGPGSCMCSQNEIWVNRDLTRETGSSRLQPNRWSC